MMGIAIYITTVYGAVQVTVVQNQMGVVGKIRRAVPTKRIVVKLGVPMTGNILNHEISTL